MLKDFCTDQGKSRTARVMPRSRQVTQGDQAAKCRHNLELSQDARIIGTPGLRSVELVR